MTHFLAPQAACSGNGFRREHILTCALSLQFCTELNQPILPNIRKWKGPRGCWKAVVSEKPSTQLQKGAGFAGFLWDTAAGVELRDATWQESSPGNGHGKPAGPSPYLVRFKVGSHDLTLVNLHLAALTLPGGENPSKSHSDSHCWASFVQTLQETLKGEKEVIVLGDFGQGPDSSDYDILRKEKFHHLVPAHTFTNISTKNPQGSKTLDNIWISKSLKKVFTELPPHAPTPPAPVSLLCELGPSLRFRHLCRACVPVSNAEPCWSD
ncbi:endonuclease/exonuclease/phosphatase family domain-containing protein 1 isoform X3 [Physeter macrocephalus]|uniref:Endonuclease/exonuclease/phosphatase family domain-containing protein 1 isoform X3 n=1 Tax=Physeter macrocephalus TaxID=9755 RepID=A0A455B003_PHYMC|nr:endonuclease/exonuclease/phosphatase family domain-containing protein 1 isoform X3 [Physeter catodon]|eukprot:XP_028342117.1 endonuclease/exonuclease/phosphatase family domain-containing protein 1 isoform X2 [Physeter catodon]